MDIQEGHVDAIDYVRLRGSDVAAELRRKGRSIYSSRGSELTNHHLTNLYLIRFAPHILVSICHPIPNSCFLLLE